MSEPRLELTSEYLDIVRTILLRYVPDREVWAFGSRVGGRVKRYSDLDLAIIGDQPLSISELSSLTEAFADSDLPYRVDVVDWATTDPHFRDIIAKTKFLISGGNRR